MFNTEAGITIPSTAGDHTVSWTDADDNEIMSNAITVETSLTADPEKGDRGTEITLKGRAWPNGTTGIYWVKGSDESFIQNVNASDGAFDLSLAPTSDFEPGENTIRARGADGNKVVNTTFDLLGSGKVSPAIVDKGGILKITLTDWGNTGSVAKVRIGGEDVDRVTETGGSASYPVDTSGAEPEDGFVFWVKVGEDVRLGAQTLVLLDAGDARQASADIEIGALSLSVTPTSAVAGQQVTVSGSGFARGSTITGTVQTKEATFPSDSDEATSSGRITVTFNIPAGVTHGTRTIQITDDESNVGQVSLTVPEPAVTVNPESSKRGSTLTVNGNGFPADENIMVEYGGGSAHSVRSDGTGSWTTAFSVPSNAEIGEDATIKASLAGSDDYTAETTHSVPAQTITLGSATASSGSTLTIAGDGFPRFASVRVVFGSHDETSLGVNTDDNGSFPATSVLVPGLDDGTIIVRVTVSGITATELLEIVPTPVITTKPSADVFADLIAMDNLIVVWYFDNDTKGWSFYDPRPAVAAAVDLNEVSSGDIVWIQITADQEFQGEMLKAGWNQITLD